MADANYIRGFRELGLKDVPLVGGKTASSSSSSSNSYFPITRTRTILRIKTEKKKVAFPRRTWQINPTPRYLGKDALRASG